MSKVLVIEDNAKNLKLAVFLLRKQGYEVLSAMTAEEGIALTQAEHPDLILMDIQLPGMDGIQATQALKAHVKIIALTAFAMDGDKQRILDAGCDGYISKPIRYQSFLADVHRFIGAD